jgi:hypothetical protein
MAITSKTGKPTSKAKVSLGIDPSRSICWVPVDMDEDLKDLLSNYNSQMNLDEGRTKDLKNELGLHMRLRAMFHEFLKKEEASITGVAEKFAVVHGKTLEELQKDLVAKQAALVRQMEAMARMEAKLAALAPAPVETKKTK